MRSPLPALAGVAALALAAGGLAACGDDETVSAVTTVTASPPTTAGSATTALPATTGTTTGAPTTTARAACGGSPIPGGAVSVTGVSGDFDGDGTEDTLTTYGEGDPSSPPPWHLHLDQGSGGAVDVVIVDADNPVSDVRPLGGSEISARAGLPPDGSGDEAFVVVNSGASDDIVGVYQFRACDLVRIAATNGTTPSTFAIGGSVTHLDGLRCDGVSGGVRLVRLSAVSADATTYDTTEEALDVQGGAFLSPNPPVQGTITSSDPTLPDFATIACPGVTYP
jgi:hypothetical protein